jgi:hypothetical protein
MNQHFVPQAFRPNRHKPSVVLGPFGDRWQARGYDSHEHFHVKTCGTWLEALATAVQWAREGYPAP